MVTMAVVLVLLALLVVGGVVAWTVRRGYEDERQSVMHYQHALETLKQVSDRSSRSSSVRLRGPAQSGEVPSGARAAEGSAHLPRASEAGPEPPGAEASPYAASESQESREDAPTEVYREGRRLLFDDLGAGHAGATRQGTDLPAGASTRGPRPARRSQGRRAVLGVAAAVVAVAVVAGAAVALATRGGGRPTRAASVATSTSTKTPRPASSPVPRSSASRTRGTSSVGGRGGRVAGRAGRHGSNAGSLQAVVTPVSYTSTSATYGAPSGSYTVVVAATTGRCWILARELSTGQVLWTGTLTPGESQQVSASGALEIDVGAATVATITLDGRSVTFPAGYQSPFLVTFEPSSSQSAA